MQVAPTDRTCFPHCIAIMMHAQGLNRSCLFSTPARRASLRCHASGGLPFQAFNQFKVEISYRDHPADICCCWCKQIVAHMIDIPQLAAAQKVVVSAKARYTLSCSSASIGLQVKPDKCEDFEEIWRKRESRLKEVGHCLTCQNAESPPSSLDCRPMLIILRHVQTPGFIRFALLRGDEAGDYISQSTVRL